ncbi:MAG TPA: tRNA lysidine(34) synthetase TilS [Usitatibacter sp.]|nr:tRNA lysidine(34) synthetase TilS [Usitatibacter sp.]
MDLEAHLGARLEAALARGTAICVGLSGGLDSMVLLDLLARAGPARGHRVSAVHVHHGLSPNADDWAAACAAACARLGVALDVRRVSVERGAPEGLEAAARAARYAAYAARPEPVVALAHHLDDQAETLLLQLLRGTGVKGAAGMPELRALSGSAVALFRPLLPIARSELRAHAVRRGIAWVEDESNASKAHDRNFLRHEVAPRLDARFAGWREALARFARHAASAEELLGELAHVDGAPRRPGEGLRVDGRLEGARRANALRAFLALEGLPMPTEPRLAEMARQLYEARDDARIRIGHGGAMLVRHRGLVHVAGGLEAGAPEGTAWRVDWRGEPDVDLGPGRGRVRFESAVGAGLGAGALGGADWHFAPRRGGERFRPDAGRPSRTLKNLLREAAVPEWQRARLPLLFQGGRLAWVPGIGVAAEFSCAPGAPGLVPAWHPAAPECAPD